MIRLRNGLICFIGIDGSGKTTLAKKITQHLGHRGIKARYSYGRFELVLTKPLVHIGNWLFLRKHDEVKDYIDYTNTKKDLFSSHSFLKQAYLYALLMDYLLQLIIKIKIPILMGNVIVCDRYIYDTMITDFTIDMSLPWSRVTSRIDSCFSLIPRPAVTFLVDVKEEVAYARKDDVPSIDYLKDRRGLYLRLARNYRMPIIDGNAGRDEVYSECLRKLDNEIQFA